MRWLVALTFPIILASCAKPVESKDIRSSGFNINYYLLANNLDQVTCKATFTMDNGVNIRLGDGDSVSCGGKSMSKMEYGTVVYYQNTLSYVPGATYEVKLYREGEGTYLATVVMPQVIVGMNPLSAFTMTKSEILNITWQPGVESTLVNFCYTIPAKDANSSSSNSCTGANYGATNGSAQVGSIKNWYSMGPQPGNWTGTLNLYRLNYGTLANGFSGVITAKNETAKVSIMIVD